jgi:hypothetical protein
VQDQYTVAAAAEGFLFLRNRICAKVSNGGATREEAALERIWPRKPGITRNKLGNGDKALISLNPSKKKLGST